MIVRSKLAGFKAWESPDSRSIVGSIQGPHRSQSRDSAWDLL